MSDLYFNGRLWRELLGNEQAVRFLEELHRRAGGSVAPTYTLEETVQEITNVDNATTQHSLGADKQRRQLADLFAGLARDNLLQQSEIKRLKQRITELENAQ